MTPPSAVPTTAAVFECQQEFCHAERRINVWWFLKQICHAFVMSVDVIMAVCCKRNKKCSRNSNSRVSNSPVFGKWSTIVSCNWPILFSQLWAKMSYTMGFTQDKPLPWCHVYVWMANVVWYLSQNNVTLVFSSSELETGCFSVAFGPSTDSVPLCIL